MAEKNGKKGTNGTKLRVAALGDPHVRENGAGALRDLLADVSANADVLVLCGDLTDHGLPEEARVLAEELKACTVPVLGVLGNHDFESGHQTEVAHILCDHGMIMLDGDPCELEGVGFAGVKGFCGGFENRMLQPWGEEIVKRFVYETVNEAMRLEGALTKLRTERKLVVLHYAPVHDTVEGEPPEVIPYLGSSRLAEPIDRFDVSAVVHGHAHFGSPQGKTTKGIPVYNTSLPLMRRQNPERPYRLLEI